MAEQDTLRVVTLDGTHEIVVPENATVREVKINGGLDITLSLKRNGQALEDDAPVRRGETLSATPNLKGGVVA